MRHLTQGVHPSIGTSSRVETYRTIGEARQTGLERALNGDGIGL